MNTKDSCKDHALELQHQEVRSGTMYVVLGCNKCGEFKEYNLNIVSEKKIEDELNFLRTSVV
jgi:hypothetical protein